MKYQITGLCNPGVRGSKTWILDQLSRNSIVCEDIDDSIYGILIFNRMFPWTKDQIDFIKDHLTPTGFFISFTNKSKDKSFHIGNFQ